MSVSKAHARVAVKKSKKAGGDSSAPSVQDARRVLAEEKLRRAIERAIASSEPLTDEQRDRLALLLSGSGVTSWNGNDRPLQRAAAVSCDADSEVSDQQVRALGVLLDGGVA